MSRTREQQEAVDRIISDIDAELRLFDTQLKFFQSDAVKNISVENMEVRYERMKLIASEIDKLQRKYYAQLQANEDDEISDRIKRFDGKYCEIAGQILKHMRKNTPSTSSQPSETNRVKTSLAKTPRIPLPEFDGSPDKWIKFRDMFKSLVHNSDSFSNIEKFHYLQAGMKIPASESNILSMFPHTADNYEKAWNAVCQRYDDKRKLLNYHLTSLHAIKKMTNNSPQELRRIIDSFESHISSLAQLGFEFNQDDSYVNLIFVFLVSRSIDEETLKEWKKDTPCDTPTYAELHSFLLARWRSLDDIPHQKQRTAKTFVSNNSNRKADKCSMCSDSHWIGSCAAFKTLSVSDRHNVVTSKQLCVNCLSKSHSLAQCSSQQTCKTCNEQHHSLLHYDSSIKQSSASGLHSQTTTFSPYSSPFQPYSSAVTTHSSVTLTSKRKILLSTVVLRVLDSSGNPHLCRALLDSGSDTSYITVALARKLNLKFNDACFQVTGIAEKTSLVRYSVNAMIKSRYGPFDRRLNFAILDSITGNIPDRDISPGQCHVPTDHFLADPNFDKAANVDMLISADLFYESLIGNKLELSNGLIMIETKFGWIMGGTSTSNIKPLSLSNYSNHQNDNYSQAPGRVFRTEQT